MYTTEQRKSLLRLFRTFRNQYRDDALAERQRVAQAITERATNGEVLTVSGGTDCDGYRHGPHFGYVQASVVAFEYARSKAYEWADGPHYFRLATPREIEEYNERCDEMEVA
jgi:hypothetical protein